MDREPLPETLWKANRDLARACREHPFVRGLASGDLPQSAFRTYVGQDAFFLAAFARAYALGAAHSGDSPARVRTFHELMGGVLAELELHRGYARELDIDLSAVEPLRATQAYVEFLLTSAWRGPVALLVAAMVPCMRLYAWLGTELAPLARPEHPFRRWIDTYADAGFQALVARLERLLDDTARDSPPTRDAYRQAMSCELAFFEAALSEPA